MCQMVKSIIISTSRNRMPQVAAFYSANLGC